MILYDLMKELYNKDIGVIPNNIFLEDVEVSIFHTYLKNKLDSIKTTLLPLGFDKCIEFNFKCHRRIWINDERDIISFWEHELNDNVPFVFEVQDLLDNDLDYLILKYGKILLREVL